MGLAGNHNHHYDCHTHTHTHPHPHPQQQPPPDAPTHPRLSTNNNNNGLPPSDPSRPPRLSRRDRDYYCFYMDLSTESQHLLPSLIRYATAYGARHSTFLDINVTHIITDKPLAVVAAYPLVKKLGIKLLELVDFLQKIVESYNRPSGLHPLRPPLSPTLKKAIPELKYTNDLSHMLAEEKRLGVAAGTMNRPARGLAPLYNAAAGAVPPNQLQAALQRLKAEPAAESNAAGPLMPLTNVQVGPKLLGVIGEKKVIYMPFKHPFLLLEECTHTFAPVYKEYAPITYADSSTHTVSTYPKLCVGSQEYHCPWINRHHGPEKDKTLIIPPPSSRPILVSHAKNRVAQTIRTLAQHRSNTEKRIQMRPRMSPRAVGRAPLPAIGFHGTPKQQPERPRPGFCECCYEKYSNLEQHIKAENHRKLVSNSEFYRTVDRVLWTLMRPAARVVPQQADGSPVSQREAPLSPAKSVASGNHLPRVKSIPLRNITNHMSHAPAAPAIPKPVQDLDIVEIGSDSPIYSSPSLKRRRSQRLVGRSTRFSGKFVL